MVAERNATPAISDGRPLPQPALAHWRAEDGTPHLLSDHLRGVGALSGQFAAKLGLAEAGDLIGLLHDFGKYSEEFQAYITSALGLKNPDEDDYVDAQALRGKVDHSTAGAQHIWSRLTAAGGSDQKAAVVAQALAICIASHHSGLIDSIGSDGASGGTFGENVFGKRMSKAEERAHLSEARLRADADVLARAECLLGDRAHVENFWAALARVVGPKPEADVAAFQAGLLLRFLFSCLIDGDRLDTIDFESPHRASVRRRGQYVPWTTLIGRLETELARLRSTEGINRTRNTIADHCRAAADRPCGTYTLTVPTGGGKTLASLRFALHHAQSRGLERVIYIVPFTSVIDQNASDVRAILEPADAPDDHRRVVLEHHASLTPEQQSWREKTLTEDWDAPVVFTTMVQFLEAFFGGGTRGARRLHQLANAVVIFDEVQTLPVKCVHLFNNAINFLTSSANSTVVLCTATQPLLHKVEPERWAARLQKDPELMPDRDQLFRDLKRVEVLDRRKPGGWTNQEIAALAVEELKRSGSCLVIVNTKRFARETFRLLEPLVPREVAYHLSTDMCPAHRRATLGKKGAPAIDTIVGRLKDGAPTLCVSTQLIEAGIDVDFGGVIRLLAGLDSIAQAAGRCNRHASRTRGTVHILNPQDESLASLPDIASGRTHAERVLADMATSPGLYGDDPLSPQAMADFYRYYFFARKAEMSYPISAAQLGYDGSLLELLSQNSPAVTEYGKRHGSKPPLFWRQAFATAGQLFKAIDAPTEAVIVPYGKAGAALIEDLRASDGAPDDWKLMRKAQQFSVSVFPGTLRKLRDTRAVSPCSETNGALILDPAFYSNQFGLSTERVSPEELLYV